MPFFPSFQQKIFTFSCPYGRIWVKVHLFLSTKFSQGSQVQAIAGAAPPRVQNLGGCIYGIKSDYHLE